MQQNLNLNLCFNKFLWRDLWAHFFLSVYFNFITCMANNCNFMRETHLKTQGTKWPGDTKTLSESGHDPDQRRLMMINKLTWCWSSWLLLSALMYRGAALKSRSGWFSRLYSVCTEGTDSIWTAGNWTWVFSRRGFNRSEFIHWKEEANPWKIK